MANDILQRPTLGGSLSYLFSDDTFFQSETTEQIHNMTCNHRPVIPTLHVKDVKGLFRQSKDRRWTCYQRSKLSLTCSYELPAWTAGRPIVLDAGNKIFKVQAMALTVTAASVGSRRSPVKIQHKYLKRKGFARESEIGIIRVRPTYTAVESGIDITRAATRAPPAVGQASSAQSIARPSAQGHSGELPLEHTFERLQLGRATANNGKRRRTQEFFELILELHAQLGADDEQGVWVNVAQRASSSFIVRGRDPKISVGEKDGMTASIPRSATAKSQSDHGLRSQVDHTSPLQ